MEQTTEIIELPLLPLRDVVVFPHMVIPLFVGREKSTTLVRLPMFFSYSSCLMAL